MTGSAQYQLAKWLTSLLQPVFQNLSPNYGSDSFTFVKKVRKFTFSPSSVFLFSFNISSLFTNVPLAETIEICADGLYKDDSMVPSFPRNIFFELMQLATSSVKFSFNNNMHRQIDGGRYGLIARSSISKHFCCLPRSETFQHRQKAVIVLSVCS